MGAEAVSNTMALDHSEWMIKKEVDWTVSKRRDCHGQYKVYVSKLTEQQLQQYAVSVTDEDVDEYLRQSEWRNHDCIVNAKYIDIQVQEKDCCSIFYTFHLYLQRIPLRLRDVNNISSPDCFYLLDAAFEGYSLLSEQFGCFLVNNQLLCFDRHGKVKTWVHPNFSHRLALEGVSSEEEMVKDIINTVERHCLITPFITTLMEELRSEPMKLGSAKVKLEELMKRNRIKVPQYFESLVEYMQRMNRNEEASHNTSEEYDRFDEEPKAAAAAPCHFGTSVISQVASGKLLTYSQGSKPIPSQASRQSIPSSIKSHPNTSFEQRPTKIVFAHKQAVGQYKHRNRYYQNKPIVSAPAISQFYIPHRFKSIRSDNSNNNVSGTNQGNNNVNTTNKGNNGISLNYSISQYNRVYSAYKPQSIIQQHNAPIIENQSYRFKKYISRGIQGEINHIVQKQQPALDSKRHSQKQIRISYPSVNAALSPPLSSNTQQIISHKFNNQLKDKQQQVDLISQGNKKQDRVIAKSQILIIDQQQLYYQQRQINLTQQNQHIKKKQICQICNASFDMNNYRGKVHSSPSKICYSNITTTYQLDEQIKNDLLKYFGPDIFT